MWAGREFVLEAAEQKDTETGETLTTFEGHSGAMYSVALSSGGKVLATGGEDEAARV